MVATGFGIIPPTTEGRVSVDFMEIESLNRVFGKTKETLYHHIVLIVSETLFQQLDIAEMHAIFERKCR